MLEFADKSLEMEPIMVCRVIALGDTDERFKFVHLLNQLMVATIDEFKLALLADEFVLSCLLAKVGAKDGAD